MFKKTGIALLMFSLVLVSVPIFTYAAELNATTYTLCDNFGREWTLTYDAVAKTLRGCRDKNNELGCGCLAAYGIIEGSHFAIVAFDTPSDSCVSTYWEGNWGMTSGSGTVYNESGPFGSFTLSLCAGAAGTAADAADPAAR